MRTQPGTSSLRALLYIDELFGYLPPTANPPSKRPLLTLLKQARAFGLGLLLATQNPVDLDYKALSNAGTWFIGRLQTERDKQRLMDGLEGAAGGLPRAEMERLLSGLGDRVFLLHNVHEDEPVLFTTRWALSYLRGPMTRQQIKRLMDPSSACAEHRPLCGLELAAGLHGWSVGRAWKQSQDVGRAAESVEAVQAQIAELEAELAEEAAELEQQFEARPGPGHLIGPFHPMSPDLLLAGRRHKTLRMSTEGWHQRECDY